MGKHIKRWRVTAEINLDASKHKTVEVSANTERKARVLGEEKIKKEGAFFVTNTKIEQIMEG